MSDEREYHQRVLELLEAAKPFVSVTMLDAIGSAPQNPGARMLVDESGRLWGTIGGGKIEMACLERARQMLTGATTTESAPSGSTNGSRSGPPISPTSGQYVEWNLQRDIGMTCGGVVRLYFEVYVQQAWRIAVFGAGHVAQALIPLLSSLKCRLWCIDTRPEWLAKLPQAANLTALHAPVPAQAVAQLPADTFLVSMTMGHAHDVPILAAALERQAAEPGAFPFIGVIGSPSKAGIIRRDLDKLGFSRAQQEAVVCPLGLPIGSNDPAEMAISISGQLLEVRDALKGGGKWSKPAYRPRSRKSS